MMGIAAAVIATLSRHNASRFVKNKVRHQTNKFFIDSSWLEKHSPLILPHVNTPLLKDIYLSLNKHSEKNLNQPELKKAYYILTQSLDLYQSNAEAILFKKNNLKSEAEFFTFIMALPMLIFICISIFIPIMLPITLPLLLLSSSFIGKTLYSINKLRGKHPANETELHYHYKNFIITLEKYKNDKPNILTPHCVSPQFSEISLTHINKENNSNASNLNSNSLFFKSTKENNANPTVKPVTRIDLI